MHTIRFLVISRMPAGSPARRLAGCILLGAVLAAASLQAQDAREIVRRSETLLRGTTSHGTFVMTVSTPDYVRSMEMESWWEGEEKALIVIRAPKKEAGNKTLKIGTEMWNYLRATETTIKIPPSMMLQAWNGSDFTNDDLVRSSSLVDDYTHRIIAEEEVAGEACWKIALTPAPDAPVVWGRLYTWIRRKDFLPAIVEYYDETGTLMRVMQYGDVRRFGARTIPARWTMINKARAGHRTEFVIRDISFDLKLPDRIFSFRELERGD